jgi:threonine/homoserine/homoserine lactone efflux protein
VHPVFEGILLGLTLAVMLGPAFFTLIQTSIHRGLGSGLLLAVGVFLSDLALVMLCYLGATQILYEGKNSLIFGMIGGIILIVFGVVTFKRKIHTEGQDLHLKKPGPLTFILKGFFLNIANPFVWLFWMGVVVGMTSSLGVNSDEVYLFLGSLLFTVIATDFLKCFVSHKIKQYLNAKILSTVNHIVGILLVVFGIALIIRVFINFAWVAA